jgi:hypothetical protein
VKAELSALKEGDAIEYWDKVDPRRRIRYEYGEPPDVVDTRRAMISESPSSGGLAGAE